MVTHFDPVKSTGAALATVVALLISGCGVGEAGAAGDESAAATPLPVEVALPVRAEIFATYHTTATLDPDADAPVLSRVEGEVVEILVEEGDFVTAGQVIARLDGDRLRLEMSAAKANLDRAEREYQRMTSLHARGLVSTASFEGMQYDVEALRATHELKRLSYGYTNIRAPISGVVSSRDVKLGQHLNVNDMAFRVTKVSTLVAYLRIPQSELSRIAVGNEAEIRVDAMPDEVFAATIDRISPTIDMKNGTFRATAYVDNSSGLLAPGMFARFNIGVERREDALTIPVGAVVDEDNVSVVYVVRDGEALRRVVETGIEDHGVVEIIRGIDATDQVVVTGQGSLRDGSRVLASLPVTSPVAG